MSGQSDRYYTLYRAFEREDDIPRPETYAAPRRPRADDPHRDGGDGGGSGGGGELAVVVLAFKGAQTLARIWTLSVISSKTAACISDGAARSLNENSNTSNSMKMCR